MTGSHLNEFIVVSMRTVSVFSENVTSATSVPRFTFDESRGSMLLPLSFFLLGTLRLVRKASLSENRSLDFVQLNTRSQ